MATRMIKDVRFNTDPSGNDFVWTQLFTAKEFIEQVKREVKKKPRHICVDSPKGSVTWSRFVDVVSECPEYEQWVYWCGDLGGWYSVPESLREWKRVGLVKYRR